MISESGKCFRHAIDGVGELGDFAFRFDKELLLQLSPCDRSNNFCNAAHLVRQIARHEVHTVGQILPRARNVTYIRLPAEPALGADFACDACHFRSERIELIHHRVHSVLELKNFAFYIDSDLFRKIATGDGCRHLGNVADLSGQVSGHRIHTVGQIFPRPSNTFHSRLTAKNSFRTHLASNARYLRCKRAELVNHRVDRVFQLRDFAFHIDCDLPRQIAIRDGGRDERNVANLRSKVARHEIDRVGQVLPRAGNASHLCLTTQNSFGTHLTCDTRNF